jgi:ribosomal small subunit protein bTHX
MGRGDKKTAKGKRTIGSFGVSRPRKKATYPATTSISKTVEENQEPVAKKAAAKKPAAKKPAAKKPAAKKPAAKKTTAKKEESK